MQAPLSSTASGNQLRPRLLPGLTPSTLSPPLHRGTQADDEGLRETRSLRRIEAWSSATVPPLQPSYLGLAEGAGLAHDAGNLLGALRLYCDLLAQPGVLREEHRHYAEELQLLSQRSRTLVERLLHPAAMTGWKNEAVPPVSVALVIEQCRGLLSAVARRAVKVVYGAGAETPVRVSHESIERILVNLTKNAAEASASGGAITLRVTRLREADRAPRVGRRLGSNRVVLSIEDHGCGMSKAALRILNEGDGTGPAIAEQPQQLHGLGLVSTKGLGRGLGLRVVRELVEASGGELRLQSRSGCGTTVEVAWAVAGDPSESAQQNVHGGRQAVSAIYGTDATKGRVSC